MTSPALLPFLACIILLCACSSGSQALSSPDGPSAAERLVVAAERDMLRFRVPPNVSAGYTIVELEPWQIYSPNAPYPAVWEGGEAAVPRIAADGRDRLYRQFLLLDPQGEPFGEPQFVTDLSAVPARTHQLLFPKEIKGLTCVIDTADGLNLGVSHTTSGLPIRTVIDWSNESPVLTHEVDAVPVPINAATIASLDQMYGEWTRNGVLYTPIPINILPGVRDPADPLIHPQTDMENNPMGLGAFDMTDEEGVRAWVAFVEFLVERYTREGAPHGQIASLIIGNELQAHWTWHNMGEAPEEQVIREYTLSLRLADLAARSIHRDFKIYASMTHHWNVRGYLNDPLKEISGVDLLDGMLEQSNAQGPFPWHVAFHPYPENLFEPAFWEDATATHRFDTPRVTFKNIEVLEAWLGQPRYLFNGQPRRIMLSEQGFHLKDTPEGEALQAAAYAASYVKVSQMSTIDAYHLHRHANHPDEGGLNLGVVDASVSPQGVWTLGKRHQLYDVFQAAGTERQDEAFAFALDVIGVDSWDAFAPDYDIDREMQETTGGDYMFDLYELAREAELDNLDAIYFETLIRDGGFPANAVFQHPPLEGEGRMTYQLVLPPVAEGELLALLFDTAIKTDQSTNGVLYRVEVDGAEVFRHEQQTRPLQGHRIDLTPYAEGEIALTLITDGKGDITYDWSLWVQPRIVKE